MRRIHIEKLSSAVTLKFADLGVLSAPQKTVMEKVHSLIEANQTAERAIDDEAHKLLDQHRKTMGNNIDEQKAFAMIKKQLAKQKGFVL